MRSSNSSINGKDYGSYFRLGKYFLILCGASFASCQPIALLTDLGNGSSNVKSNPAESSKSSLSRNLSRCRVRRCRVSGSGCF